MRIKRCKDESLNKFLKILKEEFGVTIPSAVPRLESYRNMDWEDKSYGCPPLGITGKGMFYVHLEKPLPIFGKEGRFSEAGSLCINAIRIERPIREMTAKRNRHKLDLSLWNNVLVLDINVTK